MGRGAVVLMVLLGGCVSNWHHVGDLTGPPEAPPILTACAAGGVLSDGALGGVMCHAPVQPVGRPMGDGEITLVPGPVPFLSPWGAAR